MASRWLRRASVYLGITDEEPGPVPPWSSWSFFRDVMAAVLTGVVTFLFFLVVESDSLPDAVIKGVLFSVLLTTKDCIRHGIGHWRRKRQQTETIRELSSPSEYDGKDGHLAQ